MKLKEKLYNLLNNNDRVSKFIYTLIILNVIALLMESYKPLYSRFPQQFHLFDILSLGIFSIEYLARVWVANFNGEKRKDFIFSFYGVIDFMAIIPAFLPFLFVVDLRVMRILRSFRFIRLLRIGKLASSFKTIREVLKDTREELIMTSFIAFVLLLISSTLMYFAEHNVQPEKFNSIPHSLWWAVATLTTVGYGDVYPITGTGKCISSLIAIIGIGFVALPTGIISAKFIERVRITKIHHCPQCGVELHPEDIHDEPE